MHVRRYTDILTSSGRGRSAMREAIERAPLTRKRIGVLVGEVAVTSARTTSLDVAAGAAWIAVGDAALTQDPLSGQGILFALGSAAAAAEAVKGHLSGNGEALLSYADTMRVRTLAHLSEQRDVYRAQGRWRDELFWRRRHVGQPSCLTG
jgi:flavin-dependent dehydrogenase